MRRENLAGIQGVEYILQTVCFARENECTPRCGVSEIADDVREFVGICSIPSCQK
jgi:hypothetical protein